MLSKILNELTIKHVMLPLEALKVVFHTVFMHYTTVTTEDDKTEDAPNGIIRM